MGKDWLIFAEDQIDKNISAGIDCVSFVFVTCYREQYMEIKVWTNREPWLNNIRFNFQFDLIARLVSG